MKVTGAGGSGAVGASGGARRTTGEGFTLEGAEGTAEQAPAAPLAGASALASLDALMALQGAPEPMERRRRAVRRAGRLLDMLDQVKLAILEGGGAAGALEQLRGAVREARDGTDDPRLEGVLDEIETRAAVELAKQEVSRRAA